MNLYRLTQEAVTGYDTYDSLVVCASSVKVAKRIAPSVRGDSWPQDPGFVTAQYLGKAAPSIKHGVVLASFNAG